MQGMRAPATQMSIGNMPNLADGENLVRTQTGCCDMFSVEVFVEVVDLTHLRIGVHAYRCVDLYSCEAHGTLSSSTKHMLPT